MGGSKTRVGDVKGDVFGVGVSGKGHSFKKVHVEHQHNTIHITAGEDTQELLRAISGMNTELVISSQKKAPDDAPPGEAGDVKAAIGELTRIAREIQKQGTEVRDIQSGNLRISKTELLFKKAILLKSEADELLMEQFSENNEKFAELRASKEETFEIDLADYLYRFDEKAYEEKLREASALLTEANKLDPSNVEILLHLAQVTGLLEPDHPEKERKLLSRVLNLLRNPKTDAEWFHKAEATFLLATAGDETHPELLNDARNMFKRLHRDDWVRQCDDILAGLGNIPEMANTGFAQAHAQNQPTRFQFHPTGRWHVQVSEGSIMDLQLYPNGFAQGTQQNNMIFLHAAFTGQWTFIPHSNMLQIQGYVNNSFPFFLSVAIQQERQGIFTGTGMDGHSYTFSRM
jgi:hypothetical protein